MTIYAELESPSQRGSKADIQIPCPRCGKTVMTVSRHVTGYFDPFFSHGECGYQGKLVWEKARG